MRKVDTNGIITTVAGTGKGDYSGDDGPATSADLYDPSGLAVDDWGNLYVADENNDRIRKIDTAGKITTVVGGGNQSYDNAESPTDVYLAYPTDVVLDSSGNLYIADALNHVVAKMDTSGKISIVAGMQRLNGYAGDGGPAVEARLNWPVDIDVDVLGNLYIAERNNHCIRKVDTSGIITTVAGTGTQGGYYGDWGPPTNAYLAQPLAVAVDASDNVYIADAGNHCIRKVFTPRLTISGMGPEDIGFVEENGLAHVVSGSGLHKKTIDLDTGVVVREFAYDEDNKLVSITDRFGNETTIDVGDSITSPDGLATILSINDNHLTRITYPDGSFYRLEYDSEGLLTAKVEPEGNRFDHQFDPNGRLTKGSDWHLSRTVHEDGDILAEVTSGEGNATSYLDHTCSTGKYTSTITDPTGAETLFDRSANGLSVNKSLACGMELDFEYDINPEYLFKYVKKMTESTPSGLEKVTFREKTYEVAEEGVMPDRVTEQITVNEKTTTHVTDLPAATKTLTSSEGRTVTAMCDPGTFLTTNLNIPGLYDTTYGYDTSGRLTSMSTNTRQTSFFYNGHGFLESVTDPENYTTTYTHDAVGRVTGISRPDGASLGFTYDANGNMTVLTNPSTINHGFGYNSVNLNSSYQTPISGSYSYVYDNDRRLVQTNFPSGNQINNIYDTTMLVQIQTPEGNIDYTYLCGTKVESIASGTDTITYGYDGKLLTSETLSGTLSESLGYTYYDDFNLQSFTYAGNTHIYMYDDDDLLAGTGRFGILRNAGNGLPEAVTSAELNLTRTFNGYGEVEDQDFTVSESSITSWSLTRDNTGRITAKTETIDATTSDYAYTYDPMGRLLTATKGGTLVEEYQYGPNGTRIYEMNSLKGISGRTFDYSDEDHLLTAGDTTYEYNVDGFLTTKTQGTDVTTYNYSCRGELLGVMLPEGTLIEYIHDPLGRRIAKKVNGTIVEKYLWQGLTRLLAVYDGTDGLIMRFEYADARVPVAMTMDGSTYYPTCDQVGSLRVVADASGNVVKRIDYDSFGNILNDTNPSFEIPFGFAGGLHDRDTGLVRFGYRDYDPDTGRWTAKDPILFAGGDTDLYGYCLNDPVNWADPLGLLNQGDVTGVGLAVMITTAKVGGLITAATAQALGGVATVLGVFAFSEDLNANEGFALEHYDRMKELENLEKQIEELQKILEPMLDKFHIDYDWDDPC